MTFSTNWQAHNPDPALETKVQALWFGADEETRGRTTGGVGQPPPNQAAALYVRFECHYRELFVFDDCEANGRRDHLWDRDVAEAFLQPGLIGLEPQLASHHEQPGECSYAEFEVAPNGMWIDLAIFPSGRRDLNSGLTRSVHVDKQRKIWMAELAIPLKALTSNFDPSIPWRANFYRVEGKSELRQYLAWQPTGTPQPNFHVPRAFGILRFEL